MGDQQRSAFVANQGETTQWTPGLGELVTDTTRDQAGKAIGWDGEEVTLRPLDGGQPWHTSTYRRATNTERLRARVVMYNRERCGW